MSASDMDSCLSKLRYVKRGDYVLTEDINVPNDCLRIARDWSKKICDEYGVDPSVVYELDPYISKLRYVKAGDIIEPDDHNNIVDTLKKLRDVLEKIEAEVYNKGYQAGLEAGYAQGILLDMVSDEYRTVSDSGSATTCDICAEASTDSFGDGAYV